MLLVKPNESFTKSDFASYRDENRVGNRMLFGGNLLRQPAFVQLMKDQPGAIRKLDFRNSTSNTTAFYYGANRIMNEAIFIGTYPGLTKAQLNHMIETIRNFASEF